MDRFKLSLKSENAFQGTIGFLLKEGFEFQASSVKDSNTIQDTANLLTEEETFKNKSSSSKDIDDNQSTNYNTDKKNRAKTLTGHNGSVHCLTVFNNFLVSGSADDTIKFWNKDGQCIKTLTGHGNSVYCLTIFNNYLVSGSADDTIKFWNKDGQCIKTLTGHNGSVHCLTVFNNFLVSGSFDNTIKFWDKDR